MADQPHRSLLRSAGFCIGIFVVVLVALQLYYLLVDEENAVHFSDHSTSRHGLDNMKEDDTLEGEYTYSENNEPVHFNYGKDQTHDDDITEDDMIEFNEKLPPDKDIPVMIWWTPFTLVKQTRKCNLGECFTTEDRTLQNDNRTRVFLFYGTDFSASDVPLPREGKRTIKLGSTCRDLPEKSSRLTEHEAQVINLFVNVEKRIKNGILQPGCKVTPFNKDFSELSNYFCDWGQLEINNTKSHKTEANHEWALLHEESPKNNPILLHEDTIVLFNHTSTFRRHSDCPLVTQCLESIDVLEEKPLYTLEEKARDKSKASVVYVQSSCDAPSDRDTYVQELMKHLKVDSLGACLNNKELPQEYKNPLEYANKGFYKIIANYKFTLAFENAICDDYISEKLWRPLEVGSVPIYRGSPSAQDWMPNNHSVIMVDDFPGPKELAEYIKRLDADDTAYLKYLEFKQKGGVTNQRLLKEMKERKWNMVDGGNSFITNFECLVCDRLHENLQRQKSGLPVTKHVANRNHYDCPRPVQFNYPRVKGVKQRDRDWWQAEFDEHKVIAGALNKAVLSGEKEFSLDKG